jgi:protoporphyrinogen oxidase
MHDVVIVGGGPAGVATAYFLRNSGRDVKVLEADGEVGGRTKSVTLAGHAMNTGAMFVYRDSLAEQLAHELGLTTVPFEPSTYGIHMDGRTVVSADHDSLVDALPLEREDKAALLGFIRSSLDQYARFTADGQLSSDSEALDRTSLAADLDTLPTAVRAIVEKAIRGGSVAPASELSAKYALRYFASYLAHEKKNRLYPVEGMQEIPRRMARQLAPGTVETDVRVSAVARDGPHGYVIRAESAEGTRELWARHVVFAVPAPQVAKLAPLPPWKIDALAQARTPGSTTLSVVADVSAAPALKDWAFITTMGTRFDAIISAMPGGRSPDPDVMQFVCYGNEAGYLPGAEDDPEQVAAWLEDFLRVAPELRGRVLGVHLKTWEHCFSILTPSRAAALDELQQRVGNLHFVGDYSSATAGTHGAYAEALRVSSVLSQ